MKVNKTSALTFIPQCASWADPGFLLGGGALVSCSTSTPINHIVFFFCRIPVVFGNRRSSGGGCAPPAPFPQIRPCSCLTQKRRKQNKFIKTFFSHLLFLENLIGYICSPDKDVSGRGRKFPRKLQGTIDYVTLLRLPKQLRFLVKFLRARSTISEELCSATLTSGRSVSVRRLKST